MTAVGVSLGLATVVCLIALVLAWIDELATPKDDHRHRGDDEE